MNHMPREVKTHGRFLRTKARLDASGLLFLRVAEPSALLTFKLDDDSDLGDRLAKGIEGLFLANEGAAVEAKLLGQEAGDLLWSVSSLDSDRYTSFEETLQVA